MADLNSTKPNPLVATALPLVAASAAGDTLPNRNLKVVFRNANTTTARVVTIKSYFAAQPGAMVDDIEVSVPADSDIIVTGFNNENVVNPDGRVELTYDSATDLSLAVLE